MIKGAFIFGVGLVVGTGYGVALGIKYTKVFDRAMEMALDKVEETEPAAEQTVEGSVV